MQRTSSMLEGLRTYFLQNILYGAQEILIYHVPKLLPNNDSK